MIEKLLCRLGIHSWTYKHPKTGIFLHTFIPNDCRDFVINWTKRRCDYCLKIEINKNYENSTD